MGPLRSFKREARRTGIGRNPRTGEEVNIPRKSRFKPGKELQGKDEDEKNP